MPQYRKLYTKSVESLDIAKMPDDFTRLTWLMLPLVCCREGRGMDYPTWLRSKLYPLRQDVTDDMVQDAFDWFASNGMIVRYQVDGRRYFYIKTWFEYQGNTSKETASIYPGPELVKSSAGVTPELVESKSRVGLPLVNMNNESESEDEVESESVEPFRILFDAFLEATGISELMLVGHKAVDEINGKWIPSNVTPEEVRNAARQLQDKNYSITGPWSLTNTINMLRSGKKSSANKPLSEKYKLPDGYDNDDDDYQDDDEPQPDTMWKLFIEDVPSQRWKNLLEYSGYDDDGKVIIHVPEALLPEAQSRFGSSLDRYYLGQFTLEGVAT